jgi:hypothetical protein
MCWDLRITRAKFAQERFTNTPPSGAALLAEWVDVTNLGEGSADLATIHLGHECSDLHPAQGSRKRQLRVYWRGEQGTQLRPGQTVRVHSGEARHLPSMAIADWRGVDVHAFAEGRRPLLNGDLCGCVCLCWRDARGFWFLEDQACHDALAVAGSTLIRQGLRLVEEGPGVQSTDIESLREIVRYLPARSVAGEMLSLVLPGPPIPAAGNPMPPEAGFPQTGGTVAR